jgi:ADP-ribose pyrophosphatase
MKLIDLKKVKDGTYLKNYVLTYINKAGRKKEYEIVSRRELKTPEDIGKKSSGVSMCAQHGRNLVG